MPPRGDLTTFPQIEDLNRREFMAGAFGTALLIACGSDDDDDQTATSDPNGGFPRTVKHSLGETRIPTRPERIVALADAEPLDCLLAVGLKPVLYGYSNAYGTGVPPWVTSIGGIGDIQSFDRPRGVELDLERVVGVRPDLIIDVWTEPETYSRLSAIAPTIVIKADDAILWQDVQRLAGVATGRETEAEQAIAATEAVIKAEAERVKSFAGRSVTIAYQFFDEFYMHGAQAPIGRVITDLGLSINAPDQSGLSILSLEQVRMAEDADILLSPEFIVGDAAKLEANPLFRNLAAVREGHYVPLPPEIARAGYLESA
ncbi:MAG: ABC transporter substrate-binding protein, partial [Dehalococcoidia bacterium]